MHDGTEACAFCAPAQLTATMAETEHFRVVADHAPLVPGHTLVMPHAHFACYGVVPAAWDDELAALRQRITAFLTMHYQAVVWFEHGIFHQTVYHAHLHAMPLGAVAPSVVRDPDLQGHPIATRNDLRTWYAAHGAYTYLEEPDSTAALFLPEEMRYRHLLHTLHSRTARREAWQGPHERFQHGQLRVTALLDQWRTENTG